MATLVEVKKYMETDPHGRKCPMEEIKVLTAEDRLELCEALEDLKKLEAN